MASNLVGSMPLHLGMCAASLGHQNQEIGEASETSECGNFSFLEPSLVVISDLVGE